MKRRSLKLLGVAGWACTLLLGACGGGDQPGVAAAADVQVRIASASASTSAALTGYVPGALVSVQRLGRVLPQQVSDALAAGGIVGLGAPVYVVNTYRVDYVTTDGAGQPIIASGLLALPQKGAGARSPVISYQHATIFHDADAPSNHATADEPTVILASMGFVVIAADYVGYGASRGAAHPYLLAAPTAAAVVNLLQAGSTHASNIGLRLNGQLFLVGYSEGGYATAAAHRALQLRGGELAAALVGSAPGAGPLSVTATLDELLRRIRLDNPLLAPLLDVDLFQDLGEPLRRWLRNEMLKRALPEDADVVFQTTFMDNFLANDRAALRRDSDVHDWRPTAPMRLFHGRDDQTVPFIASLAALQAMQARGAGDVLLTECRVVPSGHLPCGLPYFVYTLQQIGLVVRDL